MSDRTARLDALQTSALEYVEQRRKLLQTDLAVAKRILKGRTGQDRLASSANKATESALQTEIDEFLNP